MSLLGITCDGVCSKSFIFYTIYVCGLLFGCYLRSRSYLKERKKFFLILAIPFSHEEKHYNHYLF